MEKTNRFQNYDVAFLSEFAPDLGPVVMIKMEKSEINAPPSIYFNEIVKSMTDSGDYTQEEPISHDKYRIGGNQADSVVLTHQKGGTTYAMLYVNSLINGQNFSVTYDYVPSSFDKFLPTVDKMINSITIGAGCLPERRVLLN